jgi:acetolactate synthase-1/2/3 large subunit
MTGAEVLVAGLLAHGVEVLFALPGVQLDALFAALHDRRERLRVINARHEQGAAYMAFGYAQATGKPGAYAVVPGPGFLNTTAALSTAYACQAPVLALIGQIARDQIGVGGGELHELPDQGAILRGLTRWSAMARHPGEVPGLVAQAMGRLSAGQGPVGLELPEDMLAERAAAGPELAPYETPAPSVDQDAVHRAADMLIEAQSPLIFVGGGARAVGAELERLAVRLQAPVVSHLQGRGIIDSRHPLSIGYTEASRLWPNVDVILAVGTRFHLPRRLWGLRPGQRVIRVDADPVRFRQGEWPDIAIAGDARGVLARLLERLEREGRPARSREEEIHALKERTRQEFERSLGPQMEYVRCLRAALPEEAILVADYTQVGYVATATFEVGAPRRLITPGYQGTLGFGFATALGAKVACPGQPVVALSGDGGFLFTAMELATAVQHGIAVVCVVFSDGAYGNVKRAQERQYGGRVIASELRNPDFVRFVESFGAASRRAASPVALAEALAWAVDQRVATVIDVPVAAMPDPWDLLEPAAR